MVRLRTVDHVLREAVLALAPGPGQARFSGVASETLPAAERHRTRRPVAILSDDEAVGFFALDPADTICEYAGPEPSVALRAFFVDARRQQEGIASAALRALPRFVARHHPEAASIVLTVNTTNPVALRLYQRSGFLDTGRLHLGGTAGPQHVLVQPLRAEP